MNRPGLLVVDLQNEFLDPTTGRCLVSDVSSDSNQQPAWLDRVGKVVSHFRQKGGHIVWVRTVRSKSRNYKDPNVEEHILIVVDSDDEGEGKDGKRKSKQEPFNNDPWSSAKNRRKRSKHADNQGKSTSDLADEAFLTCKTDNPLVMPGSAGAEWYSTAKDMMKSPPDLVITKSGYSAFDGTALLEQLRIRFIGELYMCGLMTNTGILATVAEAAAHAYSIKVLVDCLGYRDSDAHHLALERMTEEYNAENIYSIEVLDAGVDAKHVEPPPVTQRFLIDMLKGLNLSEGQTPSEHDGADFDQNSGPQTSYLQFGGVPGMNSPAEAGTTSEATRPTASSGDGKSVSGVRSSSNPQILDEDCAMEIDDSNSFILPSRGNHRPPRDAGSLSSLIRTAIGVRMDNDADNADCNVMEPDDEDLAWENEGKKVSDMMIMLRRHRNTKYMPGQIYEGKSKSMHANVIDVAIGSEDVDSPTTEHSVEPALAEAEKSEQQKTPRTHSQKPSEPSIMEEYGRLAAKVTRVVRSAESVQKPKKTRKFESTAPVMSTGDKIGEGDSYIVDNLLPLDMSATIFEQLKNEVSWRSMFHRGGEVPRMVAVQGIVNPDGSFPIYRHPADESPPLLPFSPTVDKIRRYVEKKLKHEVNHVLIQLYRSGQDHISEHADKTLDITKGTSIVNVSLGAERTMILRRKLDPSVRAAQKPGEEPRPKRELQRIPLPHNSMFVLGLNTNQYWMHAIKQDKRAPELKTSAETAYDGERISLTFRHISTFLSKDHAKIYGQGATSKTKDTAASVVNGPDSEAQKMLDAFGFENSRGADFSWDATYGPGFNVLHTTEPMPKIVSGNKNDIPTSRLRLLLHEKNVRYRYENVKDHALVFIDNDLDQTTLTQSMAVLHYVDRFFGERSNDRAAYAAALEKMHHAEMLYQVWRYGGRDHIKNVMEILEGAIARGELGVETFGLAHIALLPVVVEMDSENWQLGEGTRRWLEEMRERPSVRAVYTREGEPAGGRGES